MGEEVMFRLMHTYWVPNTSIFHIYAVLVVYYAGAEICMLFLLWWLCTISLVFHETPVNLSRYGIDESLSPSAYTVDYLGTYTDTSYKIWILCYRCNSISHSLGVNNIHYSWLPLRIKRCKLISKKQDDIDIISPVRYMIVNTDLSFDQSYMCSQDYGEFMWPIIWGRKRNCIITKSSIDNICSCIEMCVPSYLHLRWSRLRPRIWKSLVNLRGILLRRNSTNWTEIR